MKLSQAQSALYKLIVGAPGARADAAKRIVRSSGRLSAARRVDIYARQYPARMHESLAADFPKLHKLLKDDAFWELVGAYAAAFPSQHHDLGQFGHQLEAFLRTHQHDDARPDLADLARLEWARAECFTEADAPVVGRAALAQLPPEAFVAARLRLVPARRVLCFGYDVLPVWKALDAGRRPPKPRPAARWAVVWRQDFDVFHLGIEPDEADALGAAGQGAPLAEVMAAFASREDAAPAAFAAFSRWVHEGLVSAVDA